MKAQKQFVKLVFSTHLLNKDQQICWEIIVCHLSDPTEEKTLLLSDKQTQFSIKMLISNLIPIECQSKKQYFLLQSWLNLCTGTLTYLSVKNNKENKLYSLYIVTFPCLLEVNLTKFNRRYICKVFTVSVERSSIYLNILVSLKIICCLYFYIAHPWINNYERINLRLQKQTEVIKTENVMTENEVT